jgi:hypothetical protein
VFWIANLIYLLLLFCVWLLAKQSYVSAEAFCSVDKVTEITHKEEMIIKRTGQKVYRDLSYATRGPEKVRLNQDLLETYALLRDLPLLNSSPESPVITEKQYKDYAQLLKTGTCIALNMYDASIVAAMRTPNGAIGAAKILSYVGSPFQITTNLVKTFSLGGLLTMEKDHWNKPKSDLYENIGFNAGFWGFSLYLSSSIMNRLYGDLDEQQLADRKRIQDKREAEQKRIRDETSEETRKRNEANTKLELYRSQAQNIKEVWNGFYIDKNFSFKRQAVGDIKLKVVAATTLALHAKLAPAETAFSSEADMLLKLHGEFEPRKAQTSQLRRALERL